MIVKIEGSYHGHHDSVQVSVYQEGEELGPTERPFSAPASSGIPRGITELTRVVPFNDNGDSEHQAMTTTSQQRHGQLSDGAVGGEPPREYCDGSYALPRLSTTRL